MKANLLKLINSIPDQSKDNRFILGIDGLSRSGKTTLVRELGQALQNKNIPVCVLHMDDYIVDRENRYQTGNDEWYEYYHLQWDVDQLTENLFGNVRVKQEINLPMYNDELDTHHTQTISLPTAGIIIIEGVFLQRAEWRDFFDAVVYIDVPRHERFARESEATQKNIEKFRNRYWKAEDHYLKNVCPAEQADLVLNEQKSHNLKTVNQ